MSHIDEMESLKKSGGPAFPMGHFRGMTLRDYFVAKAMQGLLAHPECQAVGPGCESTTQRVVLEAYAMADAMLAERANAYLDEQLKDK